MGVLDNLDFSNLSTGGTNLGTSTVSGASSQVATNPTTGVPYTPQEMLGTVVGNTGDLLGVPQDIFNLGEKIYGGVLPGRSSQVIASENTAPSAPDTSLVQKYLDSGWTNRDAIDADIAAGGGDKFNISSEPSFDYEPLRQEVGGVWDSYISGLDNLIGGIEPQAEAQRGIAQSQFGVNLGGLDLQKTQGETDLATQGTIYRKLRVKQTWLLKEHKQTKPKREV